MAVVERATAARFGDRGPVTGYRDRATGRVFPAAGGEWAGCGGGAEAVLLAGGTCRDWAGLVEGDGEEDADAERGVREACERGGAGGRRALFGRFVWEQVPPSLPPTPSLPAHPVTPSLSAHPLSLAIPRPPPTPSLSACAC